MNNYVYILECRNQNWYTGWTNDLRARFEAHFCGRGAKYTKANSPVRAVYARAFPSKREAMRAEYAIKRMTRAQKEKLAEEAGGVQMGYIFYLIGKSATGKDHIYEKLLSREDISLKPLVIYTTRPMRAGEREGCQYHFTDEEGLKKLTEEGRVVELRSYETVQGIWHYFTADGDDIDLTRGSYLGIGTLSSYRKLRKYYGRGSVIPLYIETEDSIRLERAMKREKKQPVPQYEEMCRRFLADQKDFSPAKLEAAGIQKKFQNNTVLEDCIEEVASYIRDRKAESTE